MHVILNHMKQIIANLTLACQLLARFNLLIRNFVNSMFSIKYDTICEQFNQ